MNRKFYKLTASILAVSLIASLMAGCSKKETPKDSGTTPQGQQAATEVTYPLKSDATLTYWIALNSNVSTTSQNLNDTEFAKQMEKLTGVKVKYIHPTMGQEKEQFNLLLASNDLPDIIEYNWATFVGGPEKAIKDGYIIKINDLIDKNAPDLKKYYQANDKVAKLVKTDDGSMYMFPFIRGDESLRIFHGPFLRQDWLKELNLSVPQTIDEWTTVLKAFKDKKGATAPLSFAAEKVLTEGATAWGTFVGAYGTTKNYYVQDGKVKFGPMEPAYKDFLTLFNTWYKEGLLDKNLPTVDQKMVDANMTNGKSGATVGYNGGALGKYVQAMQGKDNYDLVAAPYPTLKKGEKAKFGQIDNQVQGIGAAITSKSKNAELAAKYLNFGYTEAGSKVFNAGTEGVSYKMENGVPKYTDLIIKNPDKLTITQAMGKYMRTYSGPFVQQKYYIDNYYQLQQQKDAITAWTNTDAVKTAMPPVYPLAAESSELSKIENEVTTYMNEMYLKFVMGTEPLSNFDKYVEQLKKLNIEKAIKIKQDAYDRYTKR